MKKNIKILIFSISVVVVFLVYTFYSTGYFRKIENNFNGEFIKKVHIPGVEDMQISPTGDFMICSSDDRAGRRDGNPQKGGLYFINLMNTSFEPINLTENLNFEFNPHGISMIQTSPNHFQIYAINHVEDRHSIEVFELNKKVLTHQKTIENDFLVSPNDVAVLENNQFYFTNDHKSTSGIMKFAEDYLGLARSNVIYFNGKEFKEVASGIAYANGVAFDKKRNLLYVASPRRFMIKVFEVKANGTLEFIENIKCNTGVDNIEIQEDGSLLVGCHPSLLTFTSYFGGNIDKSPSEVIAIDYKNRGDYEVKTIFLDDGTLMSSSSVATAFGDYLFVGNVLDEHFLILKSASR